MLFFRISEQILYFIKGLILKIYFKPKKYDHLEKLGSDYGGWVIPINLLDKESICYCIGVGEDISFDLELINRFSCQVYAFDPTPRAIKYIKKNFSKIPNFHFYDIGLWSSDVELKFFAPRNPLHVSYSILNLQGTRKFFIASCKRLSNIMKDLGHQHIDLAKLNIEGAEYEVLESIIEDRLEIKILCVEFHQPMPLSKVRDMIRKLINRKYDLVNIDKWNYTFIKN
ncbi:MAG: FkbM family methyltransferase [Promethearchaeota archaeon]